MKKKIRAKLYYRLLKKFYVLFYNAPIRKDINERKGKCIQCGDCCKSINCVLQEFKNGKSYCKIHNTPMFPYSCAISPMRIDFKANKNSKRCKYYWDDTPCPK